MLQERSYFSRSIYAAECNPEKEMPLSLVMTRIIEMATLHANAWGVGYAKMIESNQGWVLSRVTVEMTHYPKVNEPYSFTTWIESYNLPPFQTLSLPKICYASSRYIFNRVSFFSLIS